MHPLNGLAIQKIHLHVQYTKSWQSVPFFSPHYILSKWFLFRLKGWLLLIPAAFFSLFWCKYYIYTPVVIFCNTHRHGGFSSTVLKQFSEQRHHFHLTNHFTMENQRRKYHSQRPQISFRSMNLIQRLNFKINAQHSLHRTHNIQNPYDDDDDLQWLPKPVNIWQRIKGKNFPILYVPPTKSPLWQDI